MKDLTVYGTDMVFTKQQVFFAVFCWIACMLFNHETVFAEGSRQLEPTGVPSSSICRLTLSRDTEGQRIPFALVGCEAVYRLNVHISDFENEKIYLGFGNTIDYADSTNIFYDVGYQIKDPAGNIVSGYELKPTPGMAGATGFIGTRLQAHSGPNINNTNSEGYTPLILSPAMNGDYVLEFDIPYRMSIFKYIDITVANGYTVIPGRLWSKAWQLSSGNVDAAVSSSHALFYIYTNDSIVTRFDCNGLAGGVWTIYSNEKGCSTTGTWNNRRRSIKGNATVQPQHKIFLNDPDPFVFPTGIIGEMISASVLPRVCDSIITFEATVSKGGNIEILIDVPPYNPGTFASEDVQLGYSVNAGYNLLIPAWDGKNAHGESLTNGTEIVANIHFLNGLTNIPLYDVEDNPNGFKVDLQRPVSDNGLSKLRLFWDDTKLPPELLPSINAIEGCLYTDTAPVPGCHEWSYGNVILGDSNTINSWWYLSTNEEMIIPIMLELLPRTGRISGPDQVCEGQLVTFQTVTIPFVEKYIWHLEGPEISSDFEIDSPENNFIYQFVNNMPEGIYTVSVRGRNPECGDGPDVFFSFYVHDDEPPPISGTGIPCINSIIQYGIPGNYQSVNWEVTNGEIVGSSDVNPVTVRWHTAGPDTIRVYSTSDCNNWISTIPVIVHPSAVAGFSISGEATACPGLPLIFTDTSLLVSGSLVNRRWTWNDGFTDSMNEVQISHSFPETGIYSVVLTVTTDQGCESEVYNPVRIIPFPEAAFSVYGNCISQSVQLEDISTGEDISSWKWDFGTAPVFADNLDLNKPTAVFNSTGEFPVSLVVTNKYGCADSVEQQVKIHSLPEARFDYDLACQGSGNPFYDQSFIADAAIMHYRWSVISPSGDEGFYYGNPAEITFAEAVNYDVELLITDAFGCIDSTLSVIDVKPQPNSAFRYFTLPDEDQGLLHLENQTTGAFEFFWDFGNGNTSSLEDPGVIFNEEGEYNILLIAISSDGCRDTTTKNYYYKPGLWMPNAFTPDNDGLNDIFRPATQRNTLDPYLLQVFSKTGQRIFYSSDPGRGWDGTCRGEPCQAGIYTYLLNFRNGEPGSTETETIRGVVCLIR